MAKSRTEASVISRGEHITTTEHRGFTQRAKGTHHHEGRGETCRPQSTSAGGGRSTMRPKPTSSSQDRNTLRPRPVTARS